jgi:tetratricopeptide (TPR) repeat protein
MKLFLFALAVYVLLGAAAEAQDVKAMIAEGDRLVEEKFDNRKALEAYQKAENADPKNYAALWRISRAYVDIAEHLPSATDKQKDEQLAMYGKALDYANRTVQANPKGMMGYLRRAIANGRVALFKGVFSVIGLVKDVKADLEKAIALNNEDKQALAVAHYVLGRTHAKVCEKPYLVRLPLGLGWGDRDIAEKEFTTAIALNSTYIMFRLDAARNLVEMDEYQKARDLLLKIPQCPVQDEDDEQCKRDAAALLKDIAGKD